MCRRTIGIIFLVLGMLLYIIRESIHYLIAAIFSLSSGSFSNTVFQTALEWTKAPYSPLIVVLCITFGLFYLIWGEISKK